MHHIKLTRRILTILLLISGSTAHAIDSDINDLVPVVAFAPVTTQSSDPIHMICIGTLISNSRMVTAAHCLPDSPVSIAIRCLADDDAPMTIEPVRSLRRHTDQDVAMVSFQALDVCQQHASTIRIAAANDQQTHVYSKRTAQLHPLDVLMDQPTNIIVSDASCLTQGDSGSPVFTKTPTGDFALTAMLISGTADCPSVQVLTKLHTLQQWLLDRPAN